MTANNRQELFADNGSEPLGPLSIGLLLMTAALWGGTPVAIRYSVEQVPVVAIAAIRFALAAVFMLIWCTIEGSPLRLRHDQMGPVLVTGVLLFAQISLFNLGVARSTSSHGSVLINTFVLWVGVIELLGVRRRRFSIRRTVGLLLAAFAGFVTLIAMPDAVQAGTGRDQPTLTGNCVLLASAALLGLRIVYIRHALRFVAPGSLIFWQDVIGVILFSAWSFTFEPPPDTPLRSTTVLGLLYQGILVAGLCFAVQARLLYRHPASHISVFGCLTPAFGIFFGTLFRGDPFSMAVVVSGLLAVAGAWCVTTADHRLARPARTDDDSGVGDPS